MNMHTWTPAQIERENIRNSLLDAGWRERKTSSGVLVYEHPAFGELEAAIIKRVTVTEAKT